jgi:PAS domain-containing protein
MTGKLPDETVSSPRHSRIGRGPGSGTRAELMARLRGLAARRARRVVAPRHRQLARNDVAASKNTPQDWPADGPTGFIGLLSPDGTLLEADDGAFEAADLSVDEALGRPFWDTSCWSWSPVVQKRLRDAVTRAAAGDVIRYDDTIRLRGNHLITIDVSLVPRMDAGVVIAVVCSAIEVTDPWAAISL